MRTSSLIAAGVAIAVAIVVLNALTTMGTYPGSNVLGWVWGGSTDDTLPGSPSVDTSTGLGWISLEAPNLSPGVPCVPPAPPSCYGIAIPETTAATSDVTGYGWSSNIGWIRFDAPPDTQTYDGTLGCVGYPETPCYSVRRIGNALIGWARACSLVDDGHISSPNLDCGGPADANSGGWEGWIKFSSDIYDPGGNYDSGVTLVQNLNKDPGGGAYDLVGYAWSPELGWLGFSGLQQAPPPDPNPYANFAVTPAPTPTPSPSSPIVSCYGSPNPAYLSSKDVVTWTAVVSSSLPITDYAWTDPVPNNPQDPVVSGSGPNLTQVSLTYKATGLKNAKVDVTSSSGSASATCKITVKAFKVKEK